MLRTEANVKNIDEFIEIYQSQEQINNELYNKSDVVNEEALNLFLNRKIY